MRAALLVESTVRAEPYARTPTPEVRRSLRAAPDAHRGRVIAGRYALLERVGSGATAIVYRARDLLCGGEVALKILHQVLVEDEAVADRFHQEAQCVKSLQHPNIVQIVDHGVCDSTHYIAMEFVPGRSLAALIDAAAPLEPARAIDIAMQILEAIRFTHDHGIIHRDLKSANVIVHPSGLVKIADFGIACTRRDGVTPPGSILGTVEYMSPERLLGDAATEACDIYSIGIILYELLAGRLPFNAELVPTLALMHLNEHPVPPECANSAVSPGLGAIVMRALEKHPRDRHQDAGTFIAALSREAVGAATTAALPAAA